MSCTESTCHMKFQRDKMTVLPPDPVYIFKGEMGPLCCVTFKINSRVEYIYGGTQGGIVHVWDLKTKREVGNFKTGDDSCLSVNIIQKEDVLITQNKSGNISFWNEDNIQWTLIKQIQTDFFGFCHATIFQNIYYTPLKDCKFQMISVKEKETIKTIHLSDDSNLGDIMSFRIRDLNDRTIILVAYEGHKLILWDLNKTEKISELQVDECPMSVDFDVNTNKGICGNPTNKVLVFSLDKNLDFNVVKSITLVNPGVATVSIRPDSKLVAVGCWDGKLRLYSWKTLVLLAVLDTHSSTIQEVCFAKECNETGRCKYLMAAASQDTKISLWDIYS